MTTSIKTSGKVSTETPAEKVARIAADLKAARAERDAAKVSTPRAGRTRVAITSLRIAKGGDVPTILREADEEYAREGGTSNPKESKWAFGVAVAVLLAVGRVTRTGDTITPVA